MSNKWKQINWQYSLNLQRLWSNCFKSNISVASWALLSVSPCYIFFILVVNNKEVNIALFWRDNIRQSLWRYITKNHFFTAIFFCSWILCSDVTIYANRFGHKLQGSEAILFCSWMCFSCVGIKLLSEVMNIKTN